ncbi:UNVERIFIED_CONTAM: Retrovirus-related Pol polyprotein from transposon RE1 [Sesamum radiatum]|uniref:Retrovirus-related Pol polyprotein from transposon RE1 n=1 Tax=Sesamum radiatum TaxID=300843 RepID=A0AAW2UMI2_SESRA
MLASSYTAGICHKFPDFSFCSSVCSEHNEQEEAHSDGHSLLLKVSGYSYFDSIKYTTSMATEGEHHANTSAANSGRRREPELPEFLQLHGGDHPGMILVNTPFDGNDFLAWRRSVVIALRAKMKLGFIDGRYIMPDKTSETYDTWVRVDSMVTSWILNAVTKKISRGFLYTKSSRQLWLDLEERYGENNGPLVYQLQRAIASITQGTLSIVEYFNNLSALWDELECLKPPKVCTCGLCTCGVTKVTTEEDNLTKLVQFLMGLDDSYDNIRNQILVMDPFPSVNKAYSMVLRVERQRTVNMHAGDVGEGVALHTRWNDHKGGNAPRGNIQNIAKGGYRGKGVIDKKSQTCSHCGRIGHTKESCFKLHGVPDWYKQLKDQKVKETGSARGFNVITADAGNDSENASNLGDAVKQMTELIKLMKENIPQQDPLQVNFAHRDDFAGTSALVTPSENGFGLWIVDTDDFSRAVWIFLLQNKAQVSSKLSSFFTSIQTKFHTHIKTIRSDNGSEFVNERCHALFQSRGIIHQRSCPHTPQQNGIVERKHKHLLNIARSLLHQASLPRKFWGECILTVAYLINRLPSPLLQWQTPYEVLYKKIPSLTHLRTFGYLCFATNVLPHKDKFDYRASKCVFIGYSQIHKGYRLYHLGDHTVFTSRDVQFHENIFPFTTTQSNPPTYLPAPIPDTEPCPVVATPQNLTTPTLCPTSTIQASSLPHSAPTNTTTLRRSQRQVNQPHWLQDFICNHTSSSFLDPICHSSFSPAHMRFLAQVEAVHEPRSFKEANQSSHWREAMNKEIEALEKNSTWELTELPAGKRAIGSRWVYKVKLNQDGSIERYKARLVANGYTQIEGIDFFDSLSPVAKTVTVRLFIAIATARHWPILQLDVNNAFLHGHLDEEVYMVPPEGYAKARDGLVCCLKRSLYGLKQASRQWNIELTSKLEAFDFKQSSHDHCLFTMRTDSSFLALIVYVDDVLLTGDSLDSLSSVKHYLDDLFTIKDLGHAKFFLGLELARSTHGTFITQKKYLMDIVRDCHLEEAKPAATPLPVGIKFDASNGPALPSPDRYRRLVGRLLYLGFSRPDISFAVQQLSQFLQHPREPHWDAALHLVRYLKGSSTLGLFLGTDSPLTLSAFSDSDWASCLDTRRSVTGYCVFLGGSLVSWKTKKQATVSRSSAEAEYRSMASTVCELLWISYVLGDFGITVVSPIPFHCDNKAAIHITENPVFHERTKHLDIDCHIVCDRFKSGFILPQHISTQHQVADLFTKALPAPQFTRLMSKLGMLSHVPT